MTAVTCEQQASWSINMPYNRGENDNIFTWEALDAGELNPDNCTRLLSGILDKHIHICSRNIRSGPGNTMEAGLLQYLLLLREEITINIGYANPGGIDAIGAVIGLVVSQLNKTAPEHRDYVRRFIDDILAHKIVMVFDRPLQAMEELRAFRKQRSREAGTSSGNNL